MVGKRNLQFVPEVSIGPQVSNAASLNEVRGRKGRSCGEVGLRGWGGATDYETRQYARAKPRKKRYLAKTILSAPGLLIQERLPVVHDALCSDGCRAREVATRLGIRDWKNHGQRDDVSIAFFDSDSEG